MGLPRDSAALVLLAAAALLPFHELTTRVGPIGLRPFETLLGVALLLGLPRLWRERRYWVCWRLVDGEVAGVVALGALALALHAGPGDSARIFRLVIVEPALFYLLATRLLPTRDGRLCLAGALVLGGVAASLVGLAQAGLGIGGVEAEGVERVRAAYRSPNNLALYLDRVVPLALALALAGPLSLWERVRVRTLNCSLSLWERVRVRADRSAMPLSINAPLEMGPHPRSLPMGEGVAAAAGALVMLVAQALTFSLGGWLATGAALVVVALLARRRDVLVALGGLATAAFSLLALWRPERIVSHLGNASDSTSTLRVWLWRSALEMLWDHPLFGIGLDNFVYLYNPARGGSYLNPAGWREPDLSHPHNLLLDWWLSLGVVGALLLVWLLVRFARLARAKLRDPGDPLERSLAIGAVGAMVATMVHGATDNSFFLADLAVLWWATFALLGSDAPEATAPARR